MRTLIFIFSLFCALLASQIPEFVQQYSQRIGGARDELDRIAQHFDEDSRKSGYDVTGALGVMGNNAEPLVRGQAVRMSDLIARRDRLQDQQAAVAAGGVGGFIAFVTKFDRPLAERTYADFRPALPFTFDGLLFALLGFAVPWALMLAAGALRRLAPSEA